MDQKLHKYVADILIGIDAIEQYLGNQKIFETYQNNALLQDAIERNLITIGEAMNNLLKLDPNIAISNSRKIVDTRNKLTHGYDDISNVQIWNILINHLPTLKVECIQLLPPNAENPTT
jgi:uncharacterized protein with HEPN domain